MMDWVCNRVVAVWVTTVNYTVRLEMQCDWIYPFTFEEHNKCFMFDDGELVVCFGQRD